ncbi:MAG: VWA domain-containing protein [Hyphomicrobiaceae bacterium]
MARPLKPRDPALPPSHRALEANIIASEVDGGRIAENILAFARILRAAGLAVGPGKVALATRAVLATGIESPRVLYWTLHAVFVARRAEHEIFNQAFVMFWKDPGFLEQMMSLMLPSLKGLKGADDKALNRRLSESLFKSPEGRMPEAEERIDIDAQGTWSAREALATKDFEQMSADELRQAQREIQRMSLPFEEILTRRFAPDPAGRRLDLRRMLRSTAAQGGDLAKPEFRKRRRRRPPIVVIADISGSMDTYARVLLHFLYGLTNDRDRVSCFLFATHLTDVTRLLKGRDPDQAIGRVSRQVTDWSGGTRIGEALATFNKRWARRVLGQNALVLLFTDGLDREGGEGIEAEARRLRANCRKLIWLNPLLRYDQYAPLALGARALSRHANEMRSCHSLASLADLAKALGGKTPPARGGPDERAQRLPMPGG